jgi:hypothetical protein
MLDSIHWPPVVALARASAISAHGENFPYFQDPLIFGGEILADSGVTCVILAVQDARKGAV